MNSFFEKLKKFYHWSNTWTGTIVIVLFIIFFAAQAFIIPSGSMKKTLLPGDALFAKKFAYGIPIPHIPWIEVPILPDFRGDGHLIDGPRPKNGDIVIFRYPLKESMHFVKRCFAVSGDEVVFNEKGVWLHPADGNLSKYKGEVASFGGKFYVLNPYMSEHKGIDYIYHNEAFDRLKSQAQQFLEAVGGDDFSGDISYDEVNSLTSKIYDVLKSKGEEVKKEGLVIGMGMHVEDGDIKYFHIKLKEDQFFMVGDNRDRSFDSRFWGPVSYRLVVGKPWFIYMSWDSNGVIRWSRVGKSVSEIEKELKEGKKPYITDGCKE